MSVVREGLSRLRFPHLTFYVSRIISQHPLRLPVRDEAARRKDDGVDAQRRFGLCDCLVGEGRHAGREAPGQKEDDDVKDPPANCLSGRERLVGHVRARVRWKEGDGR